MGLDMYLRASLYTSEYFDRDEHTKLANIGIDFPSGYTEEQKGKEAISIEWTVMYWRKANQIHKWFVENVQKGEDDCGDYLVSLDKMRELRDLCRELLVKKDPDEALEKLPPEQGFFFGGTEVDDWYWEDVKATEEAFTRILEHPRADRFDYEYHSSW